MSTDPTTPMTKSPAAMLCEIGQGHVLGDDGACINCGIKTRRMTKAEEAALLREIMQ